MKPKSKFLEVFGGSPINKVIDFMLNQKNDVAMSDIARLSGVGYSTLKGFWPRLESNGLILHTRNVGKAKMYVLNRKSKVVQHIIRLNKALT